MSALRRFFDPGRDGAGRDLGLLLLRVGLAFGLVYGHGWGKLTGLIGGGGGFPDPLGIGSGPSHLLAVLAEFVTPLAIAVGFMTRLATVPTIILFLVAFFVVHGGDAFLDREKAFLYLIGYLVVLLTGPGRMSLDHKLRRK